MQFDKDLHLSKPDRPFTPTPQQSEISSLFFLQGLRNFTNCHWPALE